MSHNDSSPSSGRRPTIDFDVPAILHSLRHHNSLSAEDIRRESIIRMEAEREIFKNQPIYKFARKLVDKSELAVARLEEHMLKKRDEAQDRRDKKRGESKFFLYWRRRYGSHFHHSGLTVTIMIDEAEDDDPLYSWAQGRALYRLAGTTPLYNSTHANSSTEILHLRHSQNQGRKPTKEDSKIARTKSVEIIQLVQHEVQPAVRRARRMSDLTTGTLDALLTSDQTTAVDSPVSVNGWRWSSGTTTTSFPPGVRPGCMRYPKTGKQEAVIVAAADAVRVGEASAYAPLAPSRRLSCLSQNGRRRMVSISYHDGNQDIGSPMIEGEDGVKRTSLVVFQFGEEVDEMIPGKSLRCLVPLSRADKGERG